MRGTNSDGRKLKRRALLLFGIAWKNIPRVNFWRKKKQIHKQDQRLWILLFLKILINTRFTKLNSKTKKKLHKYSCVIGWLDASNFLSWLTPATGLVAIAPVQRRFPVIGATHESPSNLLVLWINSDIWAGKLLGRTFKHIVATMDVERRHY